MHVQGAAGSGLLSVEGHPRGHWAPASGLSRTEVKTWGGSLR